MNKEDIDQIRLGGAKRKNGHKSTCCCHICENIKNKAKRGGYTEEMEKKAEYANGGNKKKNGHRKNCKCPICKNMNNSKKRHSKSSKRTKKRRGGDDDNDGYEEVKSEDDTNDEENKDEIEPYDDTSSDEEEENNEEEKDDEEEEEEQTEEDDEKKGGKKKRKNGHKMNCKCPICKNMRKKKGGNEPDEENQIEKGKHTLTFEEIETKASEDEYDDLDAAEKGEAGQNVVGGTRKRRRGTKWGRKKSSRKTKKALKYH